MSDIVIVFHSGYGHTAKVAEAVASTSGATLLAIDAEGNLPEGGWDALAAAKMIVFGSPTYMGMASVMKYCRVLSLSPFIDALLVKPANSLSFQACVNQALLLASANFLNCQLGPAM